LLSIGKIGSGKGAGNAAYYTRSVADGAEDYYLGRGEAPGYWTGTAADKLGLAGDVDSAQFMSLIEGRDPATGIELYAGRTRTVQAFDATFSAPKSVSLVYAVGDPAIRDQVIAAHDAAVAAGLTYLEGHAACSRVGRNGVERVEGDGFAAAVFRHRTSRAGDPQLHSHVVVPNMIEGADGTWRTLDGRALYGEAKTAGMVYQAQLRMELSQRLGLEFTVTPNGLSEIARFDRTWIDAFSQRSAEIKAEMTEFGMSTWAEAELAAQRTRQPKTLADARTEPGLETQRDYGVDPESLYGQWRTRAHDLGLTPERVDEFLGRTRYQQPSGQDLADLAASMADIDGLTKSASTFSRREVVQAFAKGFDQGLDVHSIEAVTDAFLSGQDIVPTLHPNPIETAPQGITVGEHVSPVHPAERRYSTVEMINTERRIIDTATGRTGTGTAVVPDDRVDAFLAGYPNIKTDQAAVIRHLTQSGNGVDVVQAQAGTGKTWTLGRINELYRNEGHPVIGLTAARTAVTEMGSEGIDSYTVAQFMHDIGRTPGPAVAGNAVVLIDEAAMISTRDWAQLMPVLHDANAKIILCGDTGQLPEIDAGGVFRGLHTRLDGPGLDEVIRQHNPNEIAALQQIRAGDIDTAFEFYRNNDRIIVSPKADQIRARMAVDYLDATTPDPVSGEQLSVMVFAPRREQVSALNLEIRSHVAADARLHGEPLIVPTKYDGPQPFQVGDQIRPTANWNQRGIINNDFGTITHIDHDHGSLTFQPHRRDAAPVELPPSYLAEGKVDYGYARTIHGAQGATCDQALTLGDLSVYNEMFYTQMSRARTEVTIYATAPPPTLADTIDTPIGSKPEEIDPLESLMTAAERSRGKSLAIDSLLTDKPEDLAAQRRQLLHDLAHIPSDQTELIDRLNPEIEATRTHGHEVADKLTSLGAPVTGEQPAVTSARRELMEAVEQTGQRLGDLRPRLDAARRLQTQRDEILETHAPAIDRYRQIRQHLNAEIQYRVASQEARPANYILDTLGPRPDTPTARSAWRDSVTRIERHRTEWGITDPVQALGAKPKLPGERRSAWELSGARLDDARRSIGRTSHVELAGPPSGMSDGRRTAPAVASPPLLPGPHLR
jgi:conjugative relaxase-like TrwC/TraI family protein